jgi:hypothetical protein
MAQGLGSYQKILGAVDTFGGHFWSPVLYSGPASYVQGGDGPIDPKAFGFNSSIFTLIGSIDTTNTYWAVPRLVSGGVNPVWQIVWLVQATGLEVGAGVNLSAVTAGLSAIGY